MGRLIHFGRFLHQTSHFLDRLEQKLRSKTGSGYGLKKIKLSLSKRIDISKTWQFCQNKVYSISMAIFEKKRYGKRNDSCT